MINIKSAILKYGVMAFTIELLAQVDNQILANELEQLFIEKYDSIDNGFNLRTGGSTGFKHNVQSKKKMSENHYDCTKEKNPFFNKTHTSETIALLKEKTKQQLLLKGHPGQIGVYCVETDEYFKSIKDLAQQLDMNYGTVKQLFRKHKKIKGYTYVRQQR